MCDLCDRFKHLNADSESTPHALVEIANRMQERPNAANHLGQLIDTILDMETMDDDRWYVTTVDPETES